MEIENIILHIPYAHYFIFTDLLLIVFSLGGETILGGCVVTGGDGGGASYLECGDQVSAPAAAARPARSQVGTDMRLVKATP